MRGGQKNVRHEQILIQASHAQLPQQLRAFILVEVSTGDKHGNATTRPYFRVTGQLADFLGEGFLARAVMKEDLAGAELEEEVDRLGVGLRVLADVGLQDVGTQGGHCGDGDFAAAVL
jgi:hypothetical protein